MFQILTKKLLSLKMSAENNTLNIIETAHEDIINDAVLDYFGTTLATASNDGKIKLFDVRNGQQRNIACLTDHTSPIWQLSWAHPSFGEVLASCSYDGDVIIYKKQNENWTMMYKVNLGKAANSISWAPVEFGMILAVGSADSNIHILSYNSHGNNWHHEKIQNAHSISVQSVSFAPGNNPSSLFLDESQDQESKCLRLVSGGDDNEPKIWKYDNSSKSWENETCLEGHEDWIKDVAWAPNIGLPEEQIASCSTDHKVIIWSRNHLEIPSGKNSSDDILEQNIKRMWKSTVLPIQDEVISHVSWSLTGGILACSGGADHVSLWKQDLSGEWMRISDGEHMENLKDRNDGASNNQDSVIAAET